MSTQDFEYISEAGAGSEAVVEVELRHKFPGIGGVIETRQSIPVAVRKENNTAGMPGHRLFLKHAMIKKLEDYFISKEVYKFAHVTRPVGSTKVSYFYEWAYGTEHFAWYYMDDDWNRNLIKLDDWGEFVTTFWTAGIDMGYDIVESGSEVAKNIIHQLNLGVLYPQSQMNKMWKRIDFGDGSVLINFDILKEYLSHNERSIRSYSKYERYDFMWYIAKYLSEGLTEKELVRLELLSVNFRLSTLDHLNQRGVGEDLSNSISHHFQNGDFK